MDTFLGLMDCFVKEPSLDYHPLNYQHLHHAQQADKSLMKLLQKDDSYSEQDFHGGEKLHPSFVTKAKL